MEERVQTHKKRFNTKCFPTDVGEFASECIHNNIKVIRDERVISFKEWSDSGIFLTDHLINIDSKFMSLDFKRKCPAITQLFFLGGEYKAVLNAIREYHRATEIVLIHCIKQYQTKSWLYIEKGNKTVQALIAASETVPMAVEK